MVAIVPMRHDSERVIGKNYRELGGQPLYRHIVTALTRCPQIDEVVIDTDSDVIRADARQAFPEVRVLRRPANLQAGDIPMNEVLLNTVKHADADLYLQTHSTNPFLRTETIGRAIQAFLEAGDRVDSLFSVSCLQTRLWWSAQSPINHDPNVLLRTQDLAPVYEENSCLYLFSRESLEQCGNRIGNRPMLFEIAPAEALDIDDELDFQVAECLATRVAMT